MNSLFARLLLAALGALALSGCATMGAVRFSEAEYAAASAAMARDIDILASDEFGGRLPGTEGERKTLAHIRHELEAAGFESGTNDPANPWLAPVALVRSKITGGRVALRAERGRTLALDPAHTLIYTNRRRVLIEASELVFVGRGELEVDPALIEGRSVLLIADKGTARAQRLRLLDAGAAAAIVVVREEGLIERLRGFLGRERISAPEADPIAPSVFVSESAMSAALGEERWARLVERAQASDFSPHALGWSAAIEASAQRQEFTSYNLIARHPGTDPSAGAILLLGHWDHLGVCGKEEDEDRICNGAVDNASGIAMMLELARQLAAMGAHERDLYMLATSAEEAGLLGARAFADNPPIPLESIVAAFNFDTVAIAPRGSALGFIGEGRTPLDRTIAWAMKRTGRAKGPKKLSERFLRRQDGWALLEKGVPAVMLNSGFGAREALEDFLNGPYHTALDNPPARELGGAAEDLLFHRFLVAHLARFSHAKGAD